MGDLDPARWLATAKEALAGMPFPLWWIALAVVGAWLLVYVYRGLRR